MARSPTINAVTIVKMFSFGAKNIALLKELISHLETLGENMDVARRLTRAGEWGLAFQEVYIAANKVNGGFYREHQIELERLNNLLATNSYYARFLGFPL